MNKKMSRIERLIAEKCPEGVEYRALLETPSHPKYIDFTFTNSRMP